MTDRGYKTDLFFFSPEKLVLKINNNNSVCENVDWQKGEKYKKIQVSMKNISIYRLPFTQF